MKIIKGKKELSEAKRKLLASVAERLSSRDDLFPRKTAMAKEFMRKVKGAKIID